VKASIYIRVSTSKKAQSNRDVYRQDPKVQEELCRKLVTARGWELIEVYTDRASGSAFNRPEFRRLMDDARRGKFQAVVVFSLDRWGRSLAELMNTTNDLRAMNIDFVCVDQPFDTTTLHGRLFFQICAAFAEFEREMIRERTIAGMEHARQFGTRSGNPIGRQRKIFRRDEAVRLRAEGMPLRKIARELHVGLGTVTRALQAEHQRSTTVSVQEG
jgi:putative DNA-invertase from lambdoid prophage Rac